MGKVKKCLEDYKDIITFSEYSYKVAYEEKRECICLISAFLKSLTLINQLELDENNDIWNYIKELDTLKYNEKILGELITIFSENYYGYTDLKALEKCLRKYSENNYLREDINDYEKFKISITCEGIRCIYMHINPLTANIMMRSYIMSDIEFINMKYENKCDDENMILGNLSVYKSKRFIKLLKYKNTEINELLSNLDDEQLSILLLTCTNSDLLAKNVDPKRKERLLKLIEQNKKNMFDGIINENLPIVETKKKVFKCENIIFRKAIEIWKGGQYNGL